MPLLIVSKGKGGCRKATEMRDASTTPKTRTCAHCVDRPAVGQFIRRIAGRTRRWWLCDACAEDAREGRKYCDDCLRRPAVEGPCPECVKQAAPSVDSQVGQAAS